MPDLLEKTYDPMTGLMTRTSTEESTGKMFIETFQDIETNIKLATEQRNDDDFTAKGIKAGFAKMATIPNSVVTELLGIGINVYTCPAKDIILGLKRLNKDHLLTTTRKLWRG